MRHHFLVSLSLAAGISYLGLFHFVDTAPVARLATAQATITTATTADADRLLQRQPGFFVPNLGQWGHAAKFVHRSGPMTVFLEARGWMLDLVERPAEQKSEKRIRGVALSMTFEGDAYEPHIVGEKTLPGHHNYFLGDEEKRWRTHVPLYASVRYESLYDGIDLRLREANGIPEYDLLLQPGADLSQVVVHVEGGNGISIAGDGSLVIETALGPLTQSVPKTWQMGADGTKRDVICHFTLLDTNRYGFEATDWDGDTILTIDPGLLWSTFLGGTRWDRVTSLVVDATGVVTVAGRTASSDFPAKSGAYDTTYNGGAVNSPDDAFVSRLDPSKTGSAQLVYSTFLGGRRWDNAADLSVDVSGVVTVTGSSANSDFPTTPGAFQTTYKGGSYPSTFVTRLDPNKTGASQLVYSTWLGKHCDPWALSVDASGVVTVAGTVVDPGFPTTPGAYNTTLDAGVFVSRLDPSKVGTGKPADQLVYSTFLGRAAALALSVDASGVVTVAGRGPSSSFPTTPGAYRNTRSASFVSRLDPSKVGTGKPADQLVYSTFFEGHFTDGEHSNGILFVDARGVVTITGHAGANFPTTNGAFDTIGPPSPGQGGGDAFVSQLDPSKVGTGKPADQLVYSTYLGNRGNETGRAVQVDASGIVTVAGVTNGVNFPTTPGAFDTTYTCCSKKGFVSRLDPRKVGTGKPADQLVYSTYLGGSADTNRVVALAVDASGVATVAGSTYAHNFPTSPGAYDTSFNSPANRDDAFISRLDMGVAFYADRHELPLQQAGTQNLWLNAGTVHANRAYAIFGSITGTSPGLDLMGIHIPLNYDPYTDITIGAPGPIFAKFKGTLGANGEATASFHVPAGLPKNLPSVTLHHAYIVFGASGTWRMASNAVPLRLTN